MVEIVGGVGVPHTPHFPALIAQGNPLGREVDRLFTEVRRHLRELRPDVLLLFTSDHYNVFFVESIPIFSIGVAEEAAGPSDYPDLPRFSARIDSELARALQVELVAAGFDVGMSQEFEFDHPVTVPLGLLCPEMDIPVVPVFINGLIPPLPAAARCFQLGKAVRGLLDREDGAGRVAAVASGSFSLEIGGPRISETSHTGVPDPEWMSQVLRRLGKGEIPELVEDATSEHLTRAGNAGGELLDWIAMLGVIDAGPPVMLESQESMGHSYGVWRTPSASEVAS